MQLVPVSHDRLFSHLHHSCICMKGSVYTHNVNESHYKAGIGPCNSVHNLLNAEEYHRHRIELRTYLLILVICGKQAHAPNFVCCRAV